MAVERGHIWREKVLSADVVSGCVELGVWLCGCERKNDLCAVR
ncbi:hypothetical protein PRUPE_1G062200 [Prunus persica]|uniref:Uncharacterized protein n=1 Tax=Prunus persica TaxID=3760 RepID=A0A251QT50_PRUPE|nr:hypothetical protein PRUPE_1G062200 [Prunus persica]